MAEADRFWAEGVARLHAADVAGARPMFEAAGRLGLHNAAVIHCNLVAATEDWAKGLALLAGLAASDRRCAAQLDLVRRMAIDAVGDPLDVPAGETLSERPSIRHFRKLFAPHECAFLLASARPMLEPSVVVDVATGRQVRDPVRNSDGMGFTWPLENPAVHALNRRIAIASGTPVGCGEPLQILRYRVGEEYKPHIDAIPGFANQRVLTMIAWLNEDYEGGETSFLATGLKLRGQTGDALLFANVDERGARDPRSVHAGLPVTRGEKFIASRWIRADTFVPPRTRPA